MQQKKAYNTMLNMIKEIDFNNFIKLKKKNFFFNSSSIKDEDLSETENNDQFENYNLKINLNKEFEIVVDNLIGDLTKFSQIITQEEDFKSIFDKPKLTVTEGIYDFYS